MRTLTGQSVPNITPASSDYPYGQIKDVSAPGAGDGTALLEKLGYHDVLQAMYELLRLAGVTPSETAEKKNASQICTALNNLYGLAPIAIIRAGTDPGDSVYKGLNARFAPGYSGSIVYDSWDNTNKAAKFKLTLQYNSVTTGDYLVQATLGYAGTYIGAGVGTASVNCWHNLTASPEDYVFNNDVAGNISVTAGSGSTASEVELKNAGLIITVYKAQAV